MSTLRKIRSLLPAVVLLAPVSCGSPKRQEPAADTLRSSTSPAEAPRLVAMSASPLPAPGKLCPNTEHPGVPEELVITESEFSEVRFENGYAFFRNDLASQLADSQLTTSITDNEGFWLAYGNSLILMKGFMLKQAALLEQAAGRPDSALLADRSSARVRFCEFLKSTAWVD
jgi:hypothetical protein